eukprot:2898227-Rhodomonas_salina.2
MQGETEDSQWTDQMQTRGGRRRAVSGAASGGAEREDGAAAREGAKEREREGGGRRKQARPLTVAARGSRGEKMLKLSNDLLAAIQQRLGGGREGRSGGSGVEGSVDDEE